MKAFQYRAGAKRRGKFAPEAHPNLLEDRCSRKGSMRANTKKPKGVEAICLQLGAAKTLYNFPQQEIKVHVK